MECGFQDKIWETYSFLKTLEAYITIYGIACMQKLGNKKRKKKSFVFFSNSEAGCRLSQSGENPQFLKPICKTVEQLEAITFFF